MKAVFRDRHDRVDSLKACEEARRLLADPSLLDQARRFVDQVMAADESMRPHALRWREVLRLPAAQVAALLIEDSDRGQALRETRPVFGKGLTSQDVARLIAAG